MFPTLSEMARQWATSSSYHHGVLIAPAAIFLMRRRGTKTPVSPSWTALIPLGAAAFLWTIGRALSANILEQLAFVTLVIAGFAAGFGWRRAREAAFPLAFLYFMVPFGTSFTPLMQEIAASATMGLLKAIGVGASIDGLVITTAGGRFRIAESCAGLNFLLAALMISSAFGYMSFVGWKKRAAFIALAAMLALIANIARIMMVISIATASGGEIKIAADHLLFGWGFYALLVVGLILMGRRLADPAPQTPIHLDVGAEGADERRHGPIIAAILLLVLAAISAPAIDAAIAMTPIAESIGTY